MDPKFKGVYLGVNSAPLLFKARGMRCDHLWIQDWRFIDEKGHMFKEAGVDLNDSHLYVCSYFRRALVPYRQGSFVRSLGRDGFSLHPDRGVFDEAVAQSRDNTTFWSGRILASTPCSPM